MRAAILKTGIFFFTRASAHAFENIKKHIVISTILAMLPIFSFAEQISEGQRQAEIQSRIQLNQKLFLEKRDASKDELISKFKQENEPRVRIAILALISAAHPKTSDSAKIIPLLDDKDPAVRSQVVVTLGAIGGKEATSALTKTAAHDSDVDVRRTAKSWLNSMKTRSAKKVIR